MIGVMLASLAVQVDAFSGPATDRSSDVLKVAEFIAAARTKGELDGFLVEDIYLENRKNSGASTIAAFRDYSSGCSLREMRVHSDRYSDGTPIGVFWQCAGIRGETRRADILVKDAMIARIAWGAVPPITVRAVPESQ